MAQNRMVGTTLQIDADDIRDTLPETIAYMYQYINSMALQLNAKEIGEFVPNQPAVNGQQFFGTSGRPDELRAVRRVFIYYNQPLPAAGSVSIPHNITTNPNFTVTRLYGVANRVGATRSYLPLPYANPTANLSIALEANATDIVITVGADRSVYTQTYIVMEYLIS